MPDVFLIHETSTALHFHWLKEIFPDIPIALYYHGGEVPTGSHLAEAAVPKAFAQVDAVFTNTQYSRGEVIARGCPESKVHVLPVGFDLDIYQPPSPRVYRKGGTLRLLSAGRMSEEKGYQYALRALEMLIRERDLVGIHYFLAGDGYQRRELQSFVSERGLESFVTFLGTLSKTELARQQAEADVLILPSIPVGNWVETQACAMQEMMLMKGLVIASRIGGVPESIAPELARFLVPERDARALADAVETIYRMSEPEMKMMGERAREFVLERYNIRDLNARLIRTATGAPTG